MRRFLPPVNLRLSDKDKIFKIISKYLDEIIYIPIYTAIKSKSKMVKNSLSSVRDAIFSGRIQYQAGEFSGNFNSKISKDLVTMGAKYNKIRSVYTIEYDKLPPIVQGAIETTKFKFENINKDISIILDNLQKNIDNLPIPLDKISSEYNELANYLDSKVEKSLKTITIKPTITDEMSLSIANNYTNNMSKYIKNWTEESIVKLREMVKENSLSGYRLENLIESISDMRGVSIRKATFLARQETNLFTSEIRKERFKDAGVNQYRWDIRGIRTREDHKILDRKIFSWDNPPVTNRKTGARNHPQEDFNCFCVATPLVIF